MSLRKLAEEWATAITGTSYVPMSRQEINDFLDEFCVEIAELLAAESFKPARAAIIGAKLVEAHFTAADTLAHTQRLLGRYFSKISGANPESQRRVIELLSELSNGYITTWRNHMLAEQELMKDSMWLAIEGAQRKLKESEELFLAIFEHANIGIGIGTSDGIIIITNAEMQRVLGYERDELPHKSWFALTHPLDLPRIGENISGLLANKYPSFQIRSRVIRKNGEELWTLQSISALRDSTGAIDYLVATVQDATNLYLINQAAAAVDPQDPSMGLLTRSAFASQVDMVVSQADTDERIALCMLGIDNFRTINAGLGVGVGDEVLVTLATRLRTYAESNDMRAARVGSDEFALLLKDSRGTRTVTHILENVMHVLQEPITIHGRRFSVSLSAGIVERPAMGYSSGELIEHATAALHWAKEAGKGQWMLFDEQRFVQERLCSQLALDLPGALANNELFFEYEPVFSLSDQKLLFVEALLRWDHPEYGLLPAEDFIGVVEEQGLISTLAEWMLSQVCTQGRNWQERWGTKTPRISVKLTKWQTRDAEFLAKMVNVLDSTNLDPKYLHLELRADALNGEYDNQSDDIEMLVGRGVSFSIDGFAAHDLGYLNALPLRALKSRKLIVEQIADERDPLSVKAVKDTIELAKMMELDVIAEGVDTLELISWLQEQGVQFGQGKALCAPKSAADVELLFSR